MGLDWIVPNEDHGAVTVTVGGLAVMRPKRGEGETGWMESVFWGSGRVSREGQRGRGGKKSPCFDRGYTVRVCTVTLSTNSVPTYASTSNST